MLVVYLLNGNYEPVNVRNKCSGAETVEEWRRRRPFLPAPSALSSVQRGASVQSPARAAEGERALLSSSPCGVRDSDDESWWATDATRPGGDLTKRQQVMSCSDLYLFLCLLLTPCVGYTFVNYRNCLTSL